jgi:hypothetical protein
MIGEGRLPLGPEPELQGQVADRSGDGPAAS